MARLWKVSTLPVRTFDACAVGQSVATSGRVGIGRAGYASIRSRPRLVLAGGALRARASVRAFKSRIALTAAGPLVRSTVTSVRAN